jgi:hypothetical protein
VTRIDPGSSAERSVSRLEPVVVTRIDTGSPTAAPPPRPHPAPALPDGAAYWRCYSSWQHSCRATGTMPINGCGVVVALLLLLLLLLLCCQGASCCCSSMLISPTYQESESLFHVKVVHQVMPEAARPQSPEGRAALSSIARQVGSNKITKVLKMTSRGRFLSKKGDKNSCQGSLDPSRPTSCAGASRGATFCRSEKARLTKY